MKHSITRFALGLLTLAVTPVVIACEARSGALAPSVVELYTSEGCNSCPPADRWLSSLKGRPDVIALAFHVDYWDRLGWVDRYANSAFTERQSKLRRTSGANFAYTPQVLLNGVDWRGWPAALPPPRASAIDVALTREGSSVRAQVSAKVGAPQTLTAYWAVLEDGHISHVKSGENSGATLRHDHVVRQYRPVAAWRNIGDVQILNFDAPAPALNQRVVLVIEDLLSARPVQALALSC